MSDLWEDEQLPDDDSEDWGEPEVEAEPARKKHKPSHNRVLVTSASQHTDEAAREVSDDDEFDMMPGSTRGQPAAAAAVLPTPQPRMVPAPITVSRVQQSAKSAELQERLRHLQQIEYAREDEPESPQVVLAAQASRRPGRQPAAGRQPQAVPAAPALARTAVSAAKQQQAAEGEVVVLPGDEDGAVDWQQLAQDIGATASPERGKPGAAGAAASSTPPAAGAGEAAEVVALVFRCSSGTLRLQVAKEGALGSAMEQFSTHAAQQGWLAPGKTAKFKFDGDKLTPGQTPDELGVEDEDIIDVVL